jgi:hypothetical protein
LAAQSDLVGLLRGAKHLLAAGQGGLARGQLEHRPPGELDELVRGVQIRRVGAGAHLGAHAEGVDRCCVADQVIERVFVQPAAGDDPHLAQARRVQQRPRLRRQGGEIAVSSRMASGPVRLSSRIARRHERWLPNP